MMAMRRGLGALSFTYSLHLLLSQLKEDDQARHQLVFISPERIIPSRIAWLIDDASPNSEPKMGLILTCHVLKWSLSRSSCAL
jgi:hypothetical protein